jgi:hypothetical protein
MIVSSVGLWYSCVEPLGSATRWSVSYYRVYWMVMDLFVGDVIVTGWLLGPWLHSVLSQFSPFHVFF